MPNSTHKTNNVNTGSNLRSPQYVLRNENHVPKAGCCVLPTSLTTACSCSQSAYVLIYLLQNSMLQNEMYWFRITCFKEDFTAIFLEIITTPIWKYQLTKRIIVFCMFLSSFTKNIWSLMPSLCKHRANEILDTQEHTNSIFYAWIHIWIQFRTTFLFPDYLLPHFLLHLVCLCLAPFLHIIFLLSYQPLNPLHR